MPATMAHLAGTTDPRRRAAILVALAAAEHAAGHAIRARLARIVADSELLLDDPDHEPADPVWDTVDTWHPLAATRHRPRRARLLRTIHDTWAEPLFGDEAAILLQISETELDAADTTDPGGGYTPTRDGPLPLGVNRHVWEPHEHPPAEPVINPVRPTRTADAPAGHAARPAERHPDPGRIAVSAAAPYAATILAVLACVALVGVVALADWSYKVVAGLILIIGIPVAAVTITWRR